MESAKLVSVALIGLLAAMSPGPDFAIVVKNCLRGRFQEGVWTALGIAAALIIHVTYCILGVAWVITQTSFLYLSLKYLGAAYLLYLGVMLLKEKREEEATLGKPVSKKSHSAFVSGFLCNLLNPKAALFILSLFSQFIDPSMGLLDKVLLGGVIVLVAFLWFVILSYLLTHHLLRKHFSRFQQVITKVMGCALCLLALFVILQ